MTVMVSEKRFQKEVGTEKHNCIMSDRVERNMSKKNCVVNQSRYWTIGIHNSSTDNPSVEGGSKFRDFLTIWVSTRL